MNVEKPGILEYNQQSHDDVKQLFISYKNVSFIIVFFIRSTESMGLHCFLIRFNSWFDIRVGLTPGMSSTVGFLIRMILMHPGHFG